VNEAGEPLIFRAVDYAKIGATLYLIGIFVTVIRNVQFSILSIDLLRPQAIVTGLEFLILYVGLPMLLLAFLRPVRSRRAAITIFSLLITLKEYLIWHFLAPGRLLFVAIAAVVNIAMFGTYPILRRGTTLRRPLLLVVHPSGSQLAVCLPILLSLFALFPFRAIPAYLAGGKPIAVDIFTKKEDLPLNRFMMTRNRPPINTSIPSYHLNLLYESTDYLYFVAVSHGAMKGYSIMRIRRDEVLRMDYATPLTF